MSTDVKKESSYNLVNNNNSNTKDDNEEIKYVHRRVSLYQYGIFQYSCNNTHDWHKCKLSDVKFIKV
jgi:hypothetical protein